MGIRHTLRIKKNILYKNRFLNSFLFKKVKFTLTLLYTKGISEGILFGGLQGIVGKLPKLQMPQIFFGVNPLFLSGLRLSQGFYPRERKRGILERCLILKHPKMWYTTTRISIKTKIFSREKY